jgi:hypothetical protein
MFQDLQKDRVFRGLIVIGLILHLATAAFVIGRRVEVSSIQDPFEYRVIALNVMRHGVFSIAAPAAANPDLLRGPGYPLFLAATYAAEQRGYLAIVLQQLMLVASAALVFGLLGVFAVPRKIALVLTGVFLFEPHLWLLSLQTMSETLATLLLLLMLSLSLAVPRLAAPKRHALFGLCLGALLLVRPSTLTITPFFVVLLFLADEGSMGRRLRCAALACGIALLVVSPWIARNHRLTGEWLLSSSPAFNLVDGLGATEERARIEAGEPLIDERGSVGTVFAGFTLRGYGDLRKSFGSTIARLGPAGLAARQAVCARGAWYGGHPYDLALAAFSPSLAERLTPAIRAATAVAWTAILAFFAAGSFFLLRDHSTRRMFAPLFLAIVVTVFLNVCKSYGRMLVPLHVIILIAVGAVITSGLTALRRRA